METELTETNWISTAGGKPVRKIFSTHNQLIKELIIVPYFVLFVVCGMILKSEDSDLCMTTAKKAGKHYGRLSLYLTCLSRSEILGSVQKKYVFCIKNNQKIYFFADRS